MKKSLLVVFDEIWPMTLYYSTGTLTRFWSNFKKSNTDQNQLKLLHSIRTCICIRKNYKNGEISPSNSSTMLW